MQASGVVVPCTSTVLLVDEGNFLDQSLVRYYTWVPAQGGGGGGGHAYWVPCRTPHIQHELYQSLLLTKNGGGGGGRGDVSVLVYLCYMLYSWSTVVDTRSQRGGYFNQYYSFILFIYHLRLHTAP